MRLTIFPNNFRAVALTACSLLLAGGLLHAEQFDLQPDIVVTASRAPRTVDSTLADVSVITRADIEQSAARDVIDVLRMQAGVDLYRTGGAGTQTSLFLRGTNTNQVLVLIDGVRIVSANTGALAFEQLPIDAIERIEIVRGPRASYWGSDAIGGVIQIFTRKLEGPRVTLGYGSYGDAHGTAGIGHWNGANGFSIQLGLRHVDGYPATNAGICNGPDDPYCIYNPDDNPYRNANAALRGGYRIGSQLLSATLLRSDGRSSFDQDFTTQGHSDVLQQAAGVTLKGPLTETWEHNLSLGNAREDLRTPAYSSHFESHRSSLGWRNRFSLSATQTLIAGLDLLHERGSNYDTFSDTEQYGQSRDNRALYGGWQGAFGKLDTEVSARHDDNSEFSGANTGSAALGWRFDPRWRGWASYGSGFRGPTLNEQFSPAVSAAITQATRTLIRNARAAPKSGWISQRRRIIVSD